MVLLKSSILNIFFIASYASTFHYGSIKILPPTNTTPSPTASTFHYGSIKINKSEAETLYVKKSTFHYGSIKIMMVMFIGE